AEKYKEEDEKATARIQAKNGLESFAFNIKNSLADEKVGGKLDAADKKKLEDATAEVISWLDANQEADKEEYDAKQKHLEEISNPIMMKVYGAEGGAPPMPGAAGGAPGGFPNDGASEPTIEEVD
ncbi:70-kilodalton heat shock protein, partial [Podila horticola]